MKLFEIAAAIEEFAPLAYQESYDNCGIQVGNPNAEITGALLTLDVTEAVIDEALERNCNLIVAHHPVIFSGLKRITGANYVERIVLKAIKNDIAIYAAHTNVDNVRDGVNALIAEKLGLTNCKILSPMKGNLSKLVTYAPVDVAEKVRSAMFSAGGGAIGAYSECSFNTEGNGTFKPSAQANPAIGQAGGAREQVKEERIELLVEKHLENKVLKALLSSHPYEEVAYELIPINNLNQGLGAGMVGELTKPMSETECLSHIKKTMYADVIRHTDLLGTQVKKIAVCGGSGSFLLKSAISAGADVFVTADFKYHQFFDAENRIVIADIGHYETEHFTPEIFRSVLKKKFPNFAVLLTNINTNPVKYFQ